MNEKYWGWKVLDRDVGEDGWPPARRGGSTKTQLYENVIRNTAAL